MPSDAGIDEGGTGFFDGLRELHYFMPRAAAGYQVNQRQPEDDDEIRPNRFAHTGDDLDGQAHAILIAAAPFVSASIGVRGEEFIDEIPLRAHDFDTVITGLTREGRTTYKAANLALDAPH